MKKVVLVFIVLLLSLPLRLNGQIPTVLKYIKGNSHIKEGGTDLFEYENSLYCITVVGVNVGSKNEVQCKTVGKGKALKEILEYEVGAYVTSSAKIINSESTDGKKSETKQEYKEKTEAKVIGQVSGAMTLGGWYSDDKTIYYYSMYKILQ